MAEEHFNETDFNEIFDRSPIALSYLITTPRVDDAYNNYKNSTLDITTIILNQPKYHLLKRELGHQLSSVFPGEVSQNVVYMEDYVREQIKEYFGYPNSSLVEIKFKYPKLVSKSDLEVLIYFDSDGDSGFARKLKNFKFLETYISDETDEKYAVDYKFIFRYTNKK